MKELFKLFLALVIMSSFYACGGGGSSSSTDDGGDDAGGGATTGDGSGSLAGTPYDIGTPTLTELYVSTSGSDSNDGLTLSTPFRTIDAAWAVIPTGTLTGTGWRINMVAGAHPCGADESACNNYFSDRTGTREFPIIIRSVNASGAESNGAATVRGGFDLNNVSYLYLMGLNIIGGNDLPTNVSGNNLLHIANASYVLMRNLTITGPSGRTDADNTIQEVIKVNQGDHIYLEESDLSGTFQTVVDYFSVQNGHFIGNEIYGSGGRCAYLKGGSAYFRIEGNIFHDCHEAGIQAGEGSNFPLMRSPWIHYESYDIKIVNNVIHTIYGAGLSVSGSYNVLMAYNTLYNVGMSDGRGWGLAQFIHGSRSCYVVDEYPSAALVGARCLSLTGAGGFGPDEAHDSGYTDVEFIPNKNVYIYNNIFYNDGVSTESFNFAVNGPQTLTSDVQNIADPSNTDDNLVIRGNIVWNSGITELFGSTNGSTPGCATANPTCTVALVNANNSINSFEPQLTDPAGGDFSAVAGGNVATASARSIPDFTWDAFTPSVTEGTLTNSVTENFDGEARSGAGHPGAF